MENEKDKKLCRICCLNDGKYVCPRCNVLYCSVACYRSEAHIHCSEEFYKVCITDELNSMEPNAESHERMMAILKRLNNFESDTNLDNADEELNSDDSDDDIDLIDRLKDIDLDDANQVWKRLNDEEKQCFEKLLESGDVSDIIPEFDPWWNYKDKRKVIDLEEESDFNKIHKCKCPKINDKVVPFLSISKSPPSPIVSNNLINVLAAYTFTVRYYNGDHAELFNESTIMLIALSKNLLSNQNFVDSDSAIQSVYLEIINLKALTVSGNCTDVIKKDVANILEGPDNDNLSYYILSALSDIYSLFHVYLKSNSKKCTTNSAESSSAMHEEVSLDFSKRFPDSSGLSGSIISAESIKKSKVKNCVKKIEYYLSWTVEYYKSPLSL